MSKEEILNIITNNPYLALETKFAKNFPEEYTTILQENFPETFIFKQKLYHWLHNDLSLNLGVCPVCGSKTKFISILQGYKTYCSKKCSANSKVVREKTKQTNLEKYGVDNISKSNSIKDKKKETFKTNYGCEHFTQSKELREKAKQTCLAKYGVEHSAQSKEVQEKVKNTCLKRYGVEHFYQSKEFKEKSKETCFKKYGVEYTSQTENYKKKYKETCIKKYGVTHPLKSDKIKEKSIKTNINKYGKKYYMQTDDFKTKTKNFIQKTYGVDFIMQSDTIKEKAKQTNEKRYGGIGFSSKELKEKYKKTMLDKYGVEYPLQSKEIMKKLENTNEKKYGVKQVFESKEIKDKIKNTWLKKYGVDYVFKSEKIKEKIKQTNLKNLGVEYPMQSEIVKNKSKETCFKKYGVDYTSKATITKEHIKQTNLSKYGVEWFCMHPNARLYSSNNSKPNLCFEKKLKENNISYEREFPLTKYSYDFKIENVLVEINPTITHNSQLNIFKGEPKEPNYHLNKSNTAKENGFHCIHVWDWDDKDKIVNLLKPKKTLYARNLSLMEVDEKTANIFLNKNHLQNTCRGQLIRIGLFLNGKLVQLMTFGKPRYNKNYEWELLRLCSHSNYMVVGGSEKLFSHFVKSYKPKSVISYCDLSKFTGNVYKKLGFVLTNTTKPSKHWWDGKTHITDNLLRQRGFDQLFNANYGKGTNNEELMLKHKFLPVYDCGQSVWIYKQ